MLSTLLPRPRTLQHASAIFWGTCKEASQTIVCSGHHATAKQAGRQIIWDVGVILGYVRAVLQACQA
jgi:hypothetical protein